MARLVTVPTLNVDDAISDAYVDAVTGDVNYLSMPGADLASAATINLTSSFHGVTGTTTIDNLNDAAGAVAGQPARLWIKGGPLTIRNNGGGTGNIRTRTGSDRILQTNEIISFIYDGAVWRESAPGGGAVTLIDYTVSGAAISVFDTNTILGGNILGGLRRLNLVMSVRGDSAVAEQTVLIRLNNDSGANYVWQEGDFRSTVSEASETITATSSAKVARMTAATGPASNFTPVTVELPDYAGANFKGFFSDYLLRRGAASGDLVRGFMGGNWLQAAAVTRLQILPGAGNFVVGSRFVLEAY